MSWSKQLEITNEKLDKGFGSLKKLCKYVQEKTLKNLFNPFLKPYIEYESLAWIGLQKIKSG